MLSKIAVVCAALAAGGLPAVAWAQNPQRPGPDSVVYDVQRGKVVFTHARHAQAPECKSCHHESRPEKPLTTPNEKCGSCHSNPAVGPMKTSLRRAFHDTANRAGVCFDCHKKVVESGQTAPIECDECHRRD